MTVKPTLHIVLCVLCKFYIFLQIALGMLSDCINFMFERIVIGGASELPPNWEKRLDESTGRYFYVNHGTRRTQWEPPAGQYVHCYACASMITWLVGCMAQW